MTAQKKNQGNAKQEITIANSLGKLYISQKQPEKILSLAEEIINRYPENSSAMLLLVNAQLINNQKKQAEQTLNKLVNIEKNDIQSRLILLSLLVDQPKKEKDHGFLIKN